ncbi:MAG TPA: TonB-dependent receptor [Vicinamibacterales bacterium]|nr:TonB-dependent receptor [Vicinamibacterales bacterium]
MRSGVVIGVLVAWFSSALVALAAIVVTGVVKDPSGAPVSGATVVVMTAEQTVVAAARTDAQGKFSIDVPTAGRYLLVASVPQLGESRTALDVTESRMAPLEIELRVNPLHEDVTVTASPNLVDVVRRAGQPVNIVDANDIGTRVTTAVAQAVQGEPGVELQQTSPTMAGVFVRGLTGNKVNVFVDGVRYSNGAQRGGVNTFLDLIEPGALDTIEILRGPSSAQYGSDALGGSIQFLTRPPVFGLEGAPRFGGSAGASFGTAHRFGGGQAFASYSGASLGVVGSFSGRGVGLIRPGGGVDSHAAVTRFFGLSSDTLMDERLPDTGFHQYGGSVRGQWAPSSSIRTSFSYARTFEDDGDRYDQLLGGDGNLVAELNGLSVDLFSARLESLGAAGFDHASFTYSLNSQREERVNQGGNGNANATIGHEPERTTAHGLQGVLTKQLTPRASLSVGGDVYFERLTSQAFNVTPATGAASPRRPRVPDQARFTQGGIYAQSSYDVEPDKVRLVGAIRFGGASYEARASDSPLVNGQPLWPDDSLSAFDTTFRVAGVLTPAEPWTVLLSISRGFRAPHMTDLGTLGLTGSGYEVAAPDVATLDGFVGSTADASAVSTGHPVEQLEPETSLQYEASFGYRNKIFRTDFTVFINNIHGNIQKQTLILPPGAVGTPLGGQVITSQNPNGAVFVPASTAPVLVRANFDEARVWGIEHSAQIRVRPSLSISTAFTYLHARDTTTDLPPNIEGGTPAPTGYVSARWTSAGGRWWLEPYSSFAFEQSNLSSLDLGDRRVGSGRSRSSIQSFFNNGARARGWIGPGADNVAGSADDVLIATGETLAQIQNRVLGAGVNSSSLFTAVPAYFTLGTRVGLRIQPHDVVVDFWNLTDENYRGISWGIDAPGFGVSVKYMVKF